MDASHPGHRDMLDGNAAGGRLLEAFGRDMTGARATCGHCARAAALADAVAELDEACAILLCRGCGHTMLTILRTDDRVILATSGLAALEWNEDT